MSRNLRVSICGYSLCKTPGCTPPAFDLRRNVEEASRQVELAAAEGTELVVLPEMFALQHVPGEIAGAEPLDGLVISAVARLARQHSIGIAAGHLTVEDGKTYNSFVLLDRAGRIAAVYHKTYPTIYELECGVVPGAGPLVVDTEFGRLGFAICYDLNFPELRLGYRDLDPDLILFGSAFRGGLQTQWWAYETRSYVVSSCIDCKSVIVNPVGRVVAQTDAWARTLTHTINLDCEVVHLDYSNKRLEEARRRFGKAVEFEWAEPEGVMLLTSHGSTSVRDLIRELGWQKVEDYFTESRRKREQVLSGAAVPPGPKPW